MTKQTGEGVESLTTCKGRIKLFVDRRAAKEEHDGRDVGRVISASAATTVVGVIEGHQRNSSA